MHRSHLHLHLAAAVASLALVAAPVEAYEPAPVVHGKLVLPATAGFTVLQLVGHRSVGRRILLDPADPSFEVAPGDPYAQDPAQGSGYFLVASGGGAARAVFPLPPLAAGARVPIGTALPHRDPVTGSLPEPPLTIGELCPVQPGQLRLSFIAGLAAVKTVVQVHARLQRSGSAEPAVEYELYDDGSVFPHEDEGQEYFSGDGLVNDGVLVRTITGLEPGQYRYKFLVNRNVEMGDPLAGGDSAWATARVE